MVAAPLATDKASRVRTMYATNVPVFGAHWANPNGTKGAPVAGDNQNPALFTYNDLMASTEHLDAYWFNYPTLQAGETIVGVYVDVNARYDAGTSSDVMRMKVDCVGNDGVYRSVARDASLVADSFR
ncbi:MAG: hypothetical protein IPG61_08130 [bacterium]|nr:hypothetical protein [bacterium]